jgi:hypothetical protein
MNDRPNKFLANLQKYNSQYNIKYKDQSKLMRFIGLLMFFNKTFMTAFATTINQTTYLPTNTYLADKDYESIVLLGHEYVHAYDAKYYGSFLYSLAYLFPTWLCLLSLPLYFVMGFWSLLFLVFLAPIPAIGRTWAEFRGYEMTLFLCHEILKEKKDVDIEYTMNKIARQIQDDYFHTAAYYFMWPFNMDKKFDDVVKKVVSGDILKEDKVFQEVLDAFKNSI